MRLCELDLVECGQQRDLADLVEVHAHEVGRRGDLVEVRADRRGHGRRQLAGSDLLALRRGRDSGDGLGGHGSPVSTRGGTVIDGGVRAREHVGVDGSRLRRATAGGAAGGRAAGTAGRSGVLGVTDGLVRCRGSRPGAAVSARSDPRTRPTTRATLLRRRCERWIETLRCWAKPWFIVTS